MKLNLKHLKKARVGYLYPDGHFTLIHEKKDKDAGIIEWKTVFKTIDITVTMPDNNGYLVIDRELLPFLININRIRVGKVSIENGSNNTREKNIAIQNVTFWTKGSDYGFTFTLFPNLISSDIRHIQNGKPEMTFEEDKKDYYIKVKKVYE